MSWNFDQTPNTACITCASVMNGAPVLVVTHYEDDHSWAFLDGQSFYEEGAMVVAMASVLDVHPGLMDIVDLEPGWTATRASETHAWVRYRDA